MSSVDLNSIAARLVHDVQHFESLDRAEQLALVFGALVLFGLLIWCGRVFSEWRLQRWCGREGFELLDWQGVWFFQGPNAPWRSQYQDCYRIEVRDREGYERTGYVVFGRYWLGWPFSRKVTVEWD